MENDKFYAAEQKKAAQRNRKLLVDVPFPRDMGSFRQPERWQQKTPIPEIGTGEKVKSASTNFPRTRSPSIVGAKELNCRVRNGNGWNLFAINTD